MKFPTFTFLFLILGLVFFGVIIYTVIYAESEIKKVDCFDKYGNKILDQVCLQEPMGDSEKVFLMVTGFFILILFTILGSMFDSIHDYRY